MKRDTIPCGPQEFAVACSVCGEDHGLFDCKGAPGLRLISRLIVRLPLRTVSEANRASHEHWRKRHARAKAQRSAARLVVGAHILAAGVDGSLVRYVHLTRIAPRRLDSDNAVGALKAVRDGVADALGIDDGSERVTWAYAQEKGEPREYGVRVELSR